MLTELIRQAITRLTAPVKTATYKCHRCGLSMKITNYTGRIEPILDIALTYSCKPRAKTL
ncbi:hypothetical protein OG590_40180 (plasmid) [Streptomyces goshikiensis]|uniref:hypothetical protein n=1 Tax=Streptomyces goshikiensis TaxID=1942 RepID=UPI002F91BA4D|nr:hypothetical protein OG590_40180 [Streptomyces goshikiensis]